MECLTPFSVKPKTNQNVTMAIACGKCPQCVKRRISQWSFRLMQEEKVSISTNFITMTYDTKHVPITPQGYLSLDKRDVQLFFKKLRKSHGSDHKAIKYYIVGEYGGKTKRPHYHAIIFNADIDKIAPAWGLGDIHYGSVTGASIGYTLKYMSKSSCDYVIADTQPNFALMSKGLGLGYVTLKMQKWHIEEGKNVLENRMYCNTQDNKKIAMPRYYKDRIYSKDQRKVIGAKAGILLEKNLQEKLKKNPNYYEEKVEQDKAQFTKMKINSTKNDKL